MSAPLPVHPLLLSRTLYHELSFHVIVQSLFTLNLCYCPSRTFSTNKAGSYNLFVSIIYHFSTPSRRGVLIAFEGGDKSGKSTQSRHLVYLLNTIGKDARLIKFPDRSSDSGLVIDQYLRGRVDFEPLHLHRLFARNRKEQKDKIINLLNDGINVIVDRYVHSGIAYTAARLDQMSSLLYVEDQGLPRPDLTFLLFLSGGVLESRLPPNPETGESRAFQEEVYRHYLHLLDSSYQMLDGDASEIAIFAEVRRLALRAITIYSGVPIRYF